MRKFAVTSFALLYCVLIFSASAQRSNDWAARLAPLLAHSASDAHLPCFGKMERSETHLGQTKIVEPGFVVESPRKTAGVPACSGRHTLFATSQYDRFCIGHAFYPRAPPFQI